MKALTFGSLFAGIGGFDVGFEQAGMRGLWQVEIDANCRKLLARRFLPDVAQFIDVRAVGAEQLAAVDVITAGFPCQDLSVAGKRAGLKGKRSGLFYEVVRIVRELRPRYLVWENVPGLLTSDKGRDFARVLAALADIGYFGAWRVLDARYIGVAQRRRRVFGVFARADTRSLPSSIAASLTVDAVHEAITSAENGDVRRLFELYNEVVASDSHLQGRFADRKEAVLSDTLSIQPWDKKSPDDIVAAAAIEAMIADYKDWEKACAHLLDSTLWPVSLVEKTFRPTTRPGLRYELAELTPVPYALLGYTRGKLEILPTNEDGRPIGGQGEEPEEGRYIIHRGHLLSLPDNWGGPMRSILFWWLLSMMNRDWWARFLDRYGGPFLVGKYDQADDDSRLVLLQAFQLSQKIGGLVISKETEVEIKQAAASDSGEAYKTFIELCNREKSKLILGETLSSDAQSTGLGEGTSKQQGEKRADKRQSDARRLGATLRHGLFAQYLRINGIPGRPPKAVWGSLSGDESEGTGKLISDLATGGLRVADAGLETLSERLGLPIERMPAAPAPTGILPLVAPAAGKVAAQDATDVIAAKAAPRLAAMMGSDLAPIRTIILNSKSSDEAIAGVQAFCAQRFDPSRAARVMEEAMIAITANGAAAHAR